MIITHGDRYLIWLDMFAFAWAKIGLEMLRAESDRYMITLGMSGRLWAEAEARSGR